MKIGRRKFNRSARFKYPLRHGKAAGTATKSRLKGNYKAPSVEESSRVIAPSYRENSHGIRSILTFNGGDFARFKDLEITVPS